MVRTNPTAGTLLSPILGALILSCLLPAPSARAGVSLPDDPPACVRWAGQDLRDALRDARVLSQAPIIVELRPRGDLPSESFALAVHGESVRITGGDAVGAMYGLLELAEQVRGSGVRGSWPEVAASLHSTTQRPFLEFRAVNAFIHATSTSLAFDVSMWEAYIDELARCRFNVLDLHGGYDLQTTGFPNLYPLLVHIADYPAVGDAAQQRRNLADFRRIVRYARSRGVRVAFMNYSVGRLAPRGAALADYTAKAVAELLRQVPELTMLGFRIGETGQKADFFQRAYLRGVALSGRKDVHLYTRSWLTTQQQLEEVGRATDGDFDIEIKYNGEQLGLSYQAIGKGGRSYSYEGYIKTGAPYHIIWQVRANGTHRFWAWTGTEFVRRAVRSFTFGRARGFTLEPYIAYFPTEAAAYYRSAADQSVYRYIWEKYWMWDLLWGRLSYNPELPEATLSAAFARHFGSPGPAIYAAMQAASPIVPLVCAYRYQGPDQRDWSPETETGGLARRAATVRGGFDALTYGMHAPMDPSAFAGIRDFVTEKRNTHPDGRVGPPWVARLLTESARATRTAVDQVGPVAGRPGDEWRLLKTDLLCAADLGDYHAARILGVTHLLYAVSAGSASDYDQAVSYLAQSRERWKELARTADAVFAPLDNPLRHQPQFAWSQGLPILEKLDATAPALWATTTPSPRAKPLQFTSAEQGEDPGISVDDVRHTLQSATARICCHVTARAGVKAVRLWHRDLPSESTWQQQPMAPEAGSTYEATVPVTPAGLLYFIKVEDNNGAARNFPDVLEARPSWVIDPWEFKG